METTLIILKPDAVQRGLCGRIITRFEEKGLQIVGAKLMQISPELAATHYKDHQGKPFYNGLVGFMTSSPVLVLAVRGIGAITIARSMMGHDDQGIPMNGHGSSSCQLTSRARKRCRRLSAKRAVNIEACVSVRQG